MDLSLIIFILNYIDDPPHLVGRKATIRKILELASQALCVSALSTTYPQLVIPCNVERSWLGLEERPWIRRLYFGKAPTRSTESGGFTGGQRLGDLQTKGAL